LHKGSLYQAFGDKHTLFIQTLNRYLTNVRQHKNQVLQRAVTPLGGVRAVLHHFIDMSEADSDCPQGCMAVKTLVEMAPHDAEVQRIMEDHKNVMRATMESRVAEAKANGDLISDRSPELITALIMIFMDGLATQATGPMNVEEAHAVLDAQLDALF
jgi:TetR/AcrR family transcriptional repressor of nem operon